MRKTKSRIKDVIIRDWLSLQKHIFANSWKPQLRRFRTNYVYRGGIGSRPQLHPGIFKLGKYPYETEGHLLRNFRKYADRQGASNQSVWNWLALAQHHGLPTRLLDWTYSPYVALHFATKDSESFSEDSYVFCIDYHRTNQFLPAKLKEILKEEGSNVFTAEMLDKAAGNLRDFDSLAEEPFILFFEPPSLDDRILNQYALFSFMSRPAGRLSDWLSERGGSAINLILPAKLKREIRDKLDQANITERTMSPGLDGLCAWLKRYYSVEPDME
jgi:hypothetical protein